jgi:hypothetical protein
MSILDLITTKLEFFKPNRCFSSYSGWKLQEESILDQFLVVIFYFCRHSSDELVHYLKTLA